MAFGCGSASNNTSTRANPAHISISKRERDKDADNYKTKVNASQLPHSLSTLELKKLYFIALPAFEGEMAVGVGGVSNCIMSGDKVVKGQVEWLIRCGWSADPTAPGFNWATSPMLCIQAGWQGGEERAPNR